MKLLLVQSTRKWVIESLLQNEQVLSDFILICVGHLLDDNVRCIIWYWTVWKFRYLNHLTNAIQLNMTSLCFQYYGLYILHFVNGSLKDTFHFS